MKVSLNTIGGGAAVELFDRELQATIVNIQDPNTDPEAKRTIVLEVMIEPDPKRELGAVSIACRSKLAPALPHPTMLYFGTRDGKPYAVEHNPRQTKLFADAETGEVGTEERPGSIPLSERGASRDG